MNYHKILGLVSLLILILMVPSIYGEFVIDDRETTFVVNNDPVFLPSAQNYEFDKDLLSISTYNLNIVSCDTAETKIIVSNDNFIPVAINFESNGPDFLTYSETSFVMEANSVKEISVFARAPCEAKGEYNNYLKFTVEDENPTVYELNQLVSVKKINNLEINLIDYHESECPLDLMTFEFEVSNIGTFTDNYVISLGKYDEMFDLNAGNLRLLEGTSQIVKVTGRFTPEYYGNFTIPVKVESKNNGFVAQIDLYAEVLRCHGFSLNGSSDISVCQDGDGLSESFRLDNLADFANEYDIDLVGEPSFVDLPGNYLELNANSYGLIPVGINPQSKEGRFGKEYLGQYNFSIVAESKYGDLEVKKDVSLNVNRCYDLNLSVPEISDNTVCRADRPLKLSLVNLGNFDETFDLEIETNQKAPNSQDLALSSGSLSVASGDSESFDLIFNKNDSVDLEEGRFRVDIKAYIKNRTKIYDEISLDFEKVSDKDCYEFKVAPRKVYVVSEENVTTYSNVLNVSNEGIRNSTYALSVFDETNESKLNESEVTLGAGESKEILLSTTPTNETASKGVIYVVGTTNGVSFENAVKVYYNYSNPWIWWLVGLLLLIILLLLVLVVLKKKGKKTRKQKVKRLKEKPAKSKKKGFWWVWLLVLLLLLALIALVIALVNSNGEETDCLANESNCTVDNESVADVNATAANETRTSFWSTIKGWFSREEVNTTVVNTTVTNETENPVINETAELNETNQTDSNGTKLSLWQRIKGWFSRDKGNEIVTNETVVNETELPIIEINETESEELNKTGLIEKFFSVFKTNETQTKQKIIPQDRCLSAESAVRYIEENNLEDSFEYHIMPINSIMKIELNKVFYDPDGDELSYSAREMMYIDTSIYGSDAYLVPETNFCGVQVTKFMAVDPNGGKAETPFVAIIVGPSENFLEKYSSSILVILLGLALALLIAVAYQVIPELKYKKGKKKGKGKKK